MDGIKSIGSQSTMQNSFSPKYIKPSVPPIIISSNLTAIRSTLVASEPS